MRGKETSVGNKDREKMDVCCRVGYERERVLEILGHSVSNETMFSTDPLRFSSNLAQL